MNLTESKKKEYSTRLLLSRFRILSNHGFFGMLLLHVTFGLDEKCETAYTDGYAIRFSPSFLESLDNTELDFVMMHEIMHIALKHCFRGSQTNPELFNIACDIVVNSNILYSNHMNYHAITLRKYGVSMHIAPNGKEGYLYTAEEVYNMFLEKADKESIFKKNKDKNNNSSSSTSSGNNSSNRKGSSGANGNSSNENKENSSQKNGVIDDHSHWDINGEQSRKIDEWEQRIIEAAETISITEKNTNRGIVPLGVTRLINSLKNSTLDWRTLLNDFISFEVNDYSFVPPDRRYDGPFFMPDFNEESESEKLKILFLIDTSGSMTDDEITDAFSEIRGAINQTTSLEGYLGFFDYGVYKPTRFDDVNDLLSIKPKGGGGTSFIQIFRQLDSLIEDIDGVPQAIVILTDGYADFPEEKVRRDIPVLWIINNEDVTPPWGIVARLLKNVK